MTSLHLIGKGKMSQRASLLLLEKIEELRAVPLQDLIEGQQEEQRGSFLLQWRIQTNTPVFWNRPNPMSCAVSPGSKRNCRKHFL